VLKHPATSPIPSPLSTDLPELSIGCYSVLRRSSSDRLCCERTLLWTSVPTAWAQQGPAKCRLKADPLLPGAASFLIPGLGQFLNGEDGKGLTHLLIAIVLPLP
jgi:hypothetical protein